MFASEIILPIVLILLIISKKQKKTVVLRITVEPELTIHNDSIPVEMLKPNKLTGEKIPSYEFYTSHHLYQVFILDKFRVPYNDELLL